MREILDHLVWAGFWSKPGSYTTLLPKFHWLETHDMNSLTARDSGRCNLAMHSRERRWVLGGTVSHIFHSLSSWSIRIHLQPYSNSTYYILPLTQRRKPNVHIRYCLYLKVHQLSWNTLFRSRKSMSSLGDGRSLLLQSYKAEGLF